MLGDALLSGDDHHLTLPREAAHDPGHALRRSARGPSGCRGRADRQRDYPLDRWRVSGCRPRVSHSSMSGMSDVRRIRQRTERGRRGRTPLLPSAGLSGGPGYPAGSRTQTEKGVSFVLTITHTAAEAIETIVTSTPEVPDTGGLRIARGVGPDGQQAFALSVAEAPESSDEVVDAQGVPVFLESETASLLDDKVLDARVEAGQVSFLLTDQG